MARGCRLQSAQRLRQGAGNRHARGYGNDWGRARQAAIEEHVRAFGWTCPGYNRPGHPVEPGGLTGDHRVPRAFGGTIEDGIDVLCGSCNSERGQTTRREIAALRADGQLGRRSRFLAETSPLQDHVPPVLDGYTLPKRGRRTAADLGFA